MFAGMRTTKRLTLSGGRIEPRCIVVRLRFVGHRRAHGQASLWLVLFPDNELKRFAIDYSDLPFSPVIQYLDCILTMVPCVQTKLVLDSLLAALGYRPISRCGFIG